LKLGIKDNEGLILCMVMDIRRRNNEVGKTIRHHTTRKSVKTLK
jgi:hypothetical protein